MIDPANGTPCTFTVDVNDNGQRCDGRVQHFGFQVVPTEGGTLRTGNIQIH